MNQKQPLRLLLVDDEEDIVFVLRKGLELKGHKIDSFTEPIKAVQHFSSLSTQCKSSIANIMTVRNRKKLKLESLLSGSSPVKRNVLA